MPEALALLLVGMICAGIFLWAVLHGRAHGPKTPSQQLAALRETEIWLAQRLALARAQNWDRHILEALESQWSDNQAAIRALTTTPKRP